MLRLRQYIFLLLIGGILLAGVVSGLWRAPVTLSPHTQPQPVSLPVVAEAVAVFRGDAGLTGVVRLPVELPEKLRRIWTLRTQGPVHSSPVVAEGLVFVGSLDEHVYALDLVTGVQRWAFPAAGGIEAAPLVYEGVVYIGALDGTFYALDARTGQQRWTYKAGGKIAGAANFVVQPTGTIEILFGSHDFALYCLNARTGELISKYVTGSYVNGTPALSNDATVIGGCDSQLHIISRATAPRNPIRNPTRSPRRDAVGFRPRTVEPRMAEPRTVELGSYIAASPAVLGNLAYVGHYGGRLLAIDLRAGQIVWEYGTGTQPFFSCPAVTETLVIIGGQDKKVHAVDRRTGVGRWTFATRGEVDSSPVVVGGQVVVGSDDGRLYILNLEDGVERAAYRLGPAIKTAPAVTMSVRGVMVIVGCEDGSVQAWGGF